MSLDPKADLRDWLRPRFDDSAISVPFTASSDLDIANYDAGPAWPSIAIVSSDPVPLGGGPMDMTGIDPSGAGAIQDVVYRILVDCWGGPHNADVYQTNGSDADTVAEELGREVHDKAWATPDNAPADYNGAVSSTPPRDANDVEATPTEYRRQVTVYLKATRTP
jgi:hypothetical protein